MHAIAQSPMLDVEGGDDDNNVWDSSGSLQILESLPHACFMKQVAITHVPLPRLPGSHCPSLEFVAPDGCFASTPSHAHRVRPWCGGNNAAYPMCEEIYGSAGEEFVAIIIPSKKLVCANQTMLATFAKDWVVGHVLDYHMGAMMQILGFRLVVKPSLLVPVNFWATWNNPFCYWKHFSNFLVTNDPKDDGTDLPKFLLCWASHTSTSRCKWTV